MKRIKLIELTLVNFKGIKYFQLALDGKNADVKGDNGVGKTTLYDAFTYGYYGKDSNDKADFEIKTLNADGDVAQHGLEHSVEIRMEVNGQEVTLKRSFEEKWTKKNGASKEVFTGHTTNYFIDGVPAKKKEYDEKVNEIISEDVFKLLTNPKYFNERYDWKKRRDLLLQMAGNPSDEDIAAGNTELEDFIASLNGRDMDAHLKVIRAKQKAINDELNTIPVRIDEAQLMMPEADGNEGELLAMQAKLQRAATEKQEIITGIKNGGEISNKRRQLGDLELDLSKIRNEYNERNMSGKYAIQASIQEAESNARILRGKYETNEQLAAGNKKRVAEMEQELADLRKKYVEINSELFQHNDECSCPTCGQDLPQEQIAAAREKAQAAFNQRKAERLGRLAEQGKAKAAAVDKLKAEIEKAAGKQDELNTEIERAQVKAEGLKAELQQHNETAADITQDPAFIAKTKEKHELEQAIVNLQSAAEETAASIRAEVTEIEAHLEDVRFQLGQIKAAAATRDRIKQLEAKERELTAEFEKWEREKYLAETFIRTKVEKMEDRINSLFKHANFKLFQDQLNGGLQEVCQTLYNGVPYDKGLNNAACINIGIDIINTLQRYYETYPPIFIDNAEAVTELEPTETQTVRLIVSEDHKTLDVTVKGGN